MLENGEEAFAAIGRFAEEQKIGGASLTAIGAFREATLGFFDFASKSYKEIPVAEQTEVLSAIGDIATGDDGKASLHAHVVLGLSDGSTKGGHQNRCPTSTASSARSTRSIGCSSWRCLLDMGPQVFRGTSA